MSFVSKEIRRFGYIVVNDVQVLAAQYHFECDSASDLPTQTQFQNDKNVFLFMGSTAHTITDNKQYEMKSDGTWVDMTNAPSTYDASDIIYDNAESGMTATNVQDAIDELTVLTDEDRAALVGLVDSEAKNRWKITIPTLPAGFTATIDTDGGLILNGTTGASALTFATSTQFHAGETVVLSGCPAGGSDDSYRIDILRGANTNYCYGDPVIAGAFTESAYLVRIRIAANYTCNNLKFYPMVCTLAAWKISQSFQPYRPSYQELYEMVLALQNGTAQT